MFAVQDSSFSDGGNGTPLSDHTSLTGLDLQNHGPPEQSQDQESQEAAAGSDQGVKDGEDLESCSSHSG